MLTITKSSSEKKRKQARKCQSIEWDFDDFKKALMVEFLSK